ncbi:putative cell cycle control protein [Lasiodiplodia theobromae]|uniref:Pre-mRNA-processing factor 19 n=1 Tax=Lasiodiplodia theobromae TaxID=45133 RepID=A0A5N5D605_9PEZI|nr:Cell cycle control protein [Lasiodiplodia theobromae]KAB2573188.1 Pre-mRNA-processing factor 19 [Lasiodiplodia theobromae]KAF4543918.1 Cell cycle control protein [Lasiodiplodia theobromae]KAF9629307.1 putative cell cycle control protein [Lasiodiplodia theobromae]
MLCAISGEAPQVPVASKKSGNVFEKRLIDAYIAEHGTDPVNGEELTVDDLVELKTQRVVRPRPPTLTSIPSLLAAFQNEWDAVALETYQLKQQLAQTRQELSTALYQHDAAVRVIARLTRERDEARNALSRISVSAGGGDAMQVDSASLPDAVVAKIDETHQQLSATRRKRPIPEGWATPETVQSFDTTHETESLYPGGKALALDKSGDLALTGGKDGSASVFSLSQKQVVQALKAGGSVTAGAWYNDKPVIATSTGAVKVFENGAEVAQIGSHAGAATSLSIHPCGDILASTGVDKSYILYDLSSNKQLTQVFTDAELLCGGFHPDGHLFAAGGRDGQIKVFDVKNGESMATFDAGGPLQTIAFSENGTWLAAAVQGQTTVQIWDLRKAASIKTLDIGSTVESVQWDYTGQFLAAAGAGSVAVQHYAKAGKQWSEPFRKAIPAAAVVWGASAQSLVALTAEGGLVELGSA